MHARIRLNICGMTDSLRRDANMDIPERAGFQRPVPSHQMAQQRTTLALIATAALAISTVVAVTVVSIGIARAEMLNTASADDGRLAVALFLGIVFAGMGGLTAVTAFSKARSRPRD
jgi:uncharacterized membrane protein YidH (DUF202 family)